MPPAPGPYVPDAFTDTKDGRGITWGLCHFTSAGARGKKHSVLARFDCDLSLDVDRPYFKRNNLRFNAPTYFQKGVALPGFMKQQILREQETLDPNTWPNP